MCKVGQDGTARHVRKGQGRNTVAAKKKEEKKYRGFWIFVKVQFVLSLLVLGGLGYYVLGGYALRGEIHKEAGQSGTEFTEETFRRYRKALCMRRTAVWISKLNDRRERPII